MPDHIKPLPDPEPQKPRRRWPLYLLAVLIVLALPLGLVFARIFTDRSFRHCT